MAKVIQMDTEDFFDLVHDIYELDDTKTVQGVANLLAACKFVHNHLLLDAEKRGGPAIGGWTTERFKGRSQTREMHYDALPESLDIPKCWTDGPVLECEVPLPVDQSDSA